MPSALSSQNDYYARHHRRQSSMSQSSLPDQLKNSVAAAYSPSRSAVFLPSTIYTSSSTDKPLSPPVINISHVSTQIGHPENSVNTAKDPYDPDEYYRQYQTQFALPTQVTSQRSKPHTGDDEHIQRHFVITSSMSPENTFISSTQHQGDAQEAEAEASTLQRGRPASRARRSSVKNLVAQINASSTDEIPPLPKTNISQPVSRSISPVMSFASGVPLLNEHNQMQQSDTIPNMNSSDQHGLGLMVQTNATDSRQTSRQPLFGEVFSNSPATSGPGFGIAHMRQRSGSEGSPLIMDHAQFSKISRSTDSYDEPDNYRRTFDQTPPMSTPQHRRVLSDSPVTPTSSYDLNDPFAADSSRHPTLQHQQVSSRASPMTSRSETRLQTTTLSRSSPRRRQRVSQIQSPGKSRHNDTVTQTPQSSSSLQASIIVPPPKISPPLRSSRPRLPVSSASTAASRAKMAEKFNTMQKLHNDKRAADRRPLRPPELSDIDLKARRLRITQALSRSLEGQDLRVLSVDRRRATSSSRTASPALSENSSQADRNEPVQDFHVAGQDSKNRRLDPDLRDISGVRKDGDRHYTHNALRAMSKPNLSMDPDENDSPTLGRGDATSNKPSPLQAHFLQSKGQEPPSPTLTAETEHTTIDPEPQTNLQESSTFAPYPDTHNRAARRQTSSSTRLDSSYDDQSDRTDQESVHLVLRDTAYLDESEAIRTGYRAAQNVPEPLPDLPGSLQSQGGPWSSSPQEFNVSRHEMSRLDSNSTTSEDAAAEGVEQDANHEEHHGILHRADNSARSTVDNNAYMIVNIVLQQHSTSGIVDQEFVDDVYQRILQTSPYNGEALDTNKIEQICLRELQDRENSWRKSIIGTRKTSGQSAESLNSSYGAVQGNGRRPSGSRETQPRYEDRNSAGLSPPLYGSHRYKSSLDSVEDWADTSPSVGDWMRFAVADEARKSMLKQPSPLRLETQDSQKTLVNEQMNNDKDQLATQKHIQGEEDPEMYAGPNGFASPPPPAPPAKDTPLVEQKLFGSLVEPPSVPQRLASLSQLGDQTPPSSQSPAPQAVQTSSEDPEIAEQRQLKKRRHIVKELVDTEYSYEKDLKVLCDIYKETAAAALTEEDIRVLFGNIEQIQDFSEEFLTALKTAAKPAYIMDRRDRKKDKSTDVSEAERPGSSSSTLESNKAADVEALSADKDRETRIGQAFELAFARMERIYAEYIRNRQAANMRLEVIQKSSAAREWLKVCRYNSSDITNAWNLDALLVKPVQRITKYPLLLRELVESTPSDHPDAPSLKRALNEVTEINIRINDVKKHTELVDQVLNRKRKDSEVRLGLSKAFGRRAEKLKQHLGTAEMYEDSGYNDVKIQYDNNIVHLMVVGNDCSSYGRAITKWVSKIVEIASAAEAWVDIGPTKHSEAESKLRHFAMMTRGISTIALPDHLEQLEAKVLNPMQSGVDLMNRFKNDPKGLLQKRDKKLIDYAQARNRRDKGEKIDKKMAERMEQWEALNSEAKQRMTKLVKATGVLVQHCQRNLLEMQMTWMKMIQTKLAQAMGLNLEKLDNEDIQKEWQLDFDFQEAKALSLSICNGALLAEAVNMVSFQTPSTTLNGDESPRQASYNSQQRRSISLHSNGSHAQLMESLARNSGASNRQTLEVSGDRNHALGTAFQNNRERASSSTNGGQGRMSDTSSRNGMQKRTSANRNDDRSATGAPRLSVDTPSPLIGSLSPVATKRPPSWSTFFSAATEIPPSSRHKSSGSSVFSSAMPMPDSPNVEKHPEHPPESPRDPEVLFTAASVYEFNIDRSRKEAGFPYLTYVTGEIFDIIGYNGELWLARNQDDAQGQVGWIWKRHFAKLSE